MTRTLAGVIALFLSLPHPVEAQAPGTDTGPELLWLTGIRGRIIANGRPVDFLVEVRLDSETLGRTLQTAYTLGSEEFDFLPLQVGLYDTHHLVIDHYQYEEYRQRLDMRDFFRNPRNPNQLEYAGVLSIHLTPREEDPGDSADLRGPGVVDLSQLEADIPLEASEAFRSALEDLEAGDDEDALQHLEAALEIAPEYYDVLNKLGIEYLKAGRFRDGETRLQQAHEMNPNDPRPLINLGTLHFQEGQQFDNRGEVDEAQLPYQKAIGLLEEAIRLDPLIPETNFYLGSALYETGNYERAEFLLLQALERDAELFDAHLTLVNVYARLERYPDALSQIVAYLEANPDSPQRGALESVRTQIENVISP